DQGGQQGKDHKQGAYRVDQGEGVEAKAFGAAFEERGFQPGQQEVEQVGGDQQREIGAQPQPDPLGESVPVTIGIAIAGDQHQQLPDQQAADQAQVVAQSLLVPPA